MCNLQLGQDYVVRIDEGIDDRAHDH
jgi:hypothetical protein